ncbi:class I SAM-dependent methyltransferase [Pectobacterium aquaticum]|nr:class I SAM-dependent methyltransferase [Pectobacterium aquaticum]MBN3063662.1 class I SAM-dependent methyltransferase [Pectobacterium aquaticum]
MNNADFDYSYQYNNWHTDTPESCAHDMHQAKIFFDTHAIYPQQKADKVLEIGCGMGRVMLMLREAGYGNLTGIDIDKSQTEIAKKQQLNIFLDDAVEFLQKEETKYDSIYAFDVLEHIAKEKQLDLLKRIYENATEDALVALSIPNALAPTAMLYRYEDFTHTTVYTEKTIGFLLQNAGFHFFCVRPQHHESESIQRLKLPWAKLYRHEFGIKNFILTPNLVVVAFKTKNSLEEYLKNVTPINNDYYYNDSKKPRGLRRLWGHIKKLKF